MDARSRRLRLALIFGLALGAVLATFLHAPVAQDPAYHAFADGRSFGGIPNAWNVLSNLPFLPVGVAGLVILGRARFVDPQERWAWRVFFAGVAMVAFGSAWYHLRPDNASLFWDRLPMTLAFMSLLPAVVAERMSLRAGAPLLLPMLVLGAVSVLQWRHSELAGRGDLRLYFLVQFLPMVLIPLLMALFPSRYDRGGGYGWLFAGYVAAKLLEHWDGALFRVTGGAMGGHALKHVAAALGVAALLPMLAKRRPLEAATPPDPGA